MTISKEALEAAWTAVLLQRRGTHPNMEFPPLALEEKWEIQAALCAALPFLALRPAPSQSDEKRAEKLLIAVFNPQHYKDECVALIRAAFAEATLAGAAAEREAIEGLTATLEDEQAAHQDTLRLLAAKDRENAALREALESIRAYVGDVDNWPVDVRVTSNRETIADICNCAALADPPAPDPAESMRAKCDWTVAPSSQIDSESIVPPSPPPPEMIPWVELGRALERSEMKDHAEAMRATCEAKCRDIAMLSRNLSAGAGATKCADAIAALKGKGEGL